jgi:glycosyltransferase involved in cell wall biosynthesis
MITIGIRLSIKSKLFENLKAVVVHNIAFESYYGPECALLDFLKKEKVASLLYIQHPLPPFYIDVSSRAKLYDRGRLISTIKAPSLRFKNLRLLSIYNAVATLFLVLSMKTRFHVFIGSDGRNALIGLILRKLGYVKTVVYLSHSYGEFSNPIVNAFTYCLDRYCARSVDSVWNLSHTLTKIREKQGVLKKRNVWVPVGIHHEEIRSPAKSPKLNETKKLVYVGVLTPRKGIELIIEAMPAILDKVSKVELLVVGGGPFEGWLKEACIRLSLHNNVRFLGYMDYVKLMEFLPQCHVGLAPYEPKLDNTAYTTDPLKPKLYMACGLPVIITDFPETASEVRQSGAGLVIQYDKHELVDAVVRLLTDAELFERCSVNAVKVAHKYEWSKIFDRAFYEIFQALTE